MAGTEKIYYIEQQSPILHFQYNDTNASLRATELKPKLDRFIGEWLKSKERDIPREWKMLKDPDKESGKKENNMEDAALKYQVRIFNKEGNKTYKPSRKLPYFGNIGDDTEKKMCIMAKGGIELHIRCFIKELQDVIDDCLPTFFLTTNFGTRQDKGFGSFVLCGSENRKENEKLLIQWYGKNRVYCIRYETKTPPEDKLADIDTIYKILKSGINDPAVGHHKKRTYIKSYLWEYFNARGIDWEKKSLKHQGIAPAVYSDPNYAPTPPGPKERYIRGLLGAGDQQQWFSSDGSGTMIIDYYNQNGREVYKKETISIKSKNNDIERIPTPLMFKIIGDAIYIIPEDVDSRILGSRFEFINESKRSITLQIPQEGEFDLDEILKGFRDKINSPEVKMEFEKRKEEKRPVFIRQNCSMEVLGDEP